MRVYVCVCVCNTMSLSVFTYAVLTWKKKKTRLSKFKEDDYHGNRYLGALRWNDVRGGTWSPMMKQTQDPKYEDGFMVIGWRSMN